MRTPFATLVYNSPVCSDWVINVFAAFPEVCLSEEKTEWGREENMLSWKVRRDRETA